MLSPAVSFLRSSDAAAEEPAEEIAQHLQPEPTPGSRLSFHVENTEAVLKTGSHKQRRDVTQFISLLASLAREKRYDIRENNQRACGAFQLS